MQTQKQANNIELDLDLNIAKAVGLLRDKKLKIGFAESCTGGLLSSYFTQMSGVSDVFDGSVVSYANSVKEDVLGVKRETLIQYGAVSKECAAEMVAGALKVLKTDVAIAITGIAGPNGGTEAKPVGTVYIAVAGTIGAKSNSNEGGSNQKKLKVINNVTKHFFGEDLKTTPALGRNEIQKLSCLNAVKTLNELLKDEVEK